MSIPLRKSAKSAGWSSTPWLSLAGCRCLHGLAMLMDMPITFDTAHNGDSAFVVGQSTDGHR